jgi:hypothetical protein
MSDLPETWKPIAHTESRYVVSDAGRVRGPHGKVLKPTLLQIGYYSVALSLGRKGVRRRYVHRLVAEAFVGAIGDDEVVNHKNHDKLDNRATNLEIISRSANTAHWATLGKSPDVKKKSNGLCGRGHPLHTTRKGARYCKECARLRVRGDVPSPPSDTEWRPTAFAGYLVSADGRVWSLRTNRILRHGVNKPGYQYVTIRVDGGQQPKTLHRLVAQAFIGDVPDGSVVDHINGDRQDNRVENLRILTHSENIRAYRDVCRRTGRHGFKHDAEVIARVKRDLLDKKYTHAEIALRNGISRSHVGNIACGNQWAHVSPADGEGVDDGPPMNPSQSGREEEPQSVLHTQNQQATEQKPEVVAAEDANPDPSAASGGMIPRRTAAFEN